MFECIVAASLIIVQVTLLSKEDDPLKFTQNPMVFFKRSPKF